MTKTPLTIIATKQATPEFLALPYTLYRGETQWRAPLRMERKAQLSPKNPAFKAIEPCFLVAKTKDRSVGRLAVFLNGAHDQAHGAGTAFFGYFDCEDDPAISEALLSAAKTWARDKGCQRLRGPAMWSVNEEVGLLVHGYEHPPAVMMPYGHPHQAEALQKAGFDKVVDLYAYLADLSDGAPQAKLVSGLRRRAASDPGLTWRSLDTSNFMTDVRMARDIFNDAWSDNWGFIPFSETQFTHMAKEMKPIMFRSGFQIGFIDDEPATFVWMIPDVNDAVRGLDGRLLPFGWATLLWRLKMKKVSQGRIPLMGLKKKFQKGRRGVALTTQICSEAFDAGQAQGFKHCELSWVLEDNRSMKGICDLVGAHHYKTYRMVEAVL